MRSKEYWAKRSALDMVAYMRTAEQTSRLMSETSEQALDVVRKEIEGIFSSFSDFGISDAEARRILSADGTMLQRIRRAAEKVKDPKQKQALLTAINSAGAYRWRIQLLEEVSKQITKQCKGLYKTQLADTTNTLRSVAEDAYYHTIFNVQKETGLAFSFAQLPKKQIDRILALNWSGEHYSQRIWRNTDILAQSIKDELLVSLLSGRSNAKTVRAIREQFNVNSFCAWRLVRTESSYVSNAAVSEGYKEADIEKYRYLATLDSRTSEKCAELDGKVFLLAEKKVGTNFPPMHPFCRSTTLAEFGEETMKKLERRARDKDGKVMKVPADMTYQEWAEKYVPGWNTKPGKSDNAIADMAFINRKEYEKQFRGWYANPKVEKAVVDCCRAVIKNRNGTKFEELFAVDCRNGRVLSYIKGKSENGVQMTDKIRKLLTNSPDGSIIILHNHPNSSPFSTKDIETAIKYKSIAQTIAAGHNGTVYSIDRVYGCENAIRDYRVAYTKYHDGLKIEDFESRNKAWLSSSKQNGYNYERRVKNAET